MIIEYTRTSADRVIKSKYFTAYRWAKSKDAIIIHDLWDVIVKNPDENFDAIYRLHKLYSKLTTVKSKASISKDENRIEITNKSVIFPNILILKND